MHTKISILEILRLTRPFNISAKIKSEKLYPPRKDIIFFSRCLKGSPYYCCILFYKKNNLYALYKYNDCIFASWKKHLFLRDFKRFLIKNHKKF